MTPKFSVPTLGCDGNAEREPSIYTQEVSASLDLLTSFSWFCLGGLSFVRNPGSGLSLAKLV
jgi:hypothetical protein